MDKLVIIKGKLLVKDGDTKHHVLLSSKFVYFPSFQLTKTNLCHPKCKSKDEIMMFGTSKNVRIEYRILNKKSYLQYFMRFTIEYFIKTNVFTIFTKFFNVKVSLNSHTNNLLNFESTQ